MSASEIRSATLGCEDLEAALRFWRDVVGFEELWRCEVSGPGLERAWSLPAGARARVAFLRYGGVATGQVRLVEMQPRERVFARTWEDDAWAAGVGALDLGVRDAERTFALLRDAGYPSRNPHPHFYVLGGLEQSEAVFRGPDHVNVLLVGARNYPAELAPERVPGDFSPLTVVSQFVLDFDAAARFYGEGLGLQQVFDVWTDERSRPVVTEMVGIPGHADVRLAAYRSQGSADGKVLLLATRGVEVKRIARRMQPDRLGVAMLSHATDDLDGLRARLPRLGGELAGEPAEIRFGSHAATRGFLVRTPDGVLLELYEQVS